jgi:hypothetical protein
MPQFTAPMWWVQESNPVVVRSSAPNTYPEGGCHGLFTIVQEPCARFGLRDALRLLRAWSETDAS